MSIHEYKCEICGSVTSKLFRNSDIPDSLECGNCGFSAYKMLSRPNIIHDSVNEDCDVPGDIDGIVEMGYEIGDIFTGEVIEREIVIVPIKYRGEKLN